MDGMDGFLLENAFWLGLAAASACGLVWTFARAGQSALSPQSAILSVSREKGVFVDVRPAAEYASGHIVNARNVPSSELDERAPSLEKYRQRPIVVVCQNGMRGRAAMAQLQKKGFDKARVLAGGMAAWREAQLPISTKTTERR